MFQIKIWFDVKKKKNFRHDIDGNQNKFYE